MFIGVDGCVHGWVAVAIGDEGFVAARRFSAFTELAAAHTRATSIGVDIPIGLVDEPARFADQAARRFLKGNARSTPRSPFGS